ncbi:unnamed protein product [Prunus armeniaca]
MEEFDFRWGGVAPKYSNHENCTLQLHHGGVLESGEYKNGKVCYLDNVIEDFLSLGDLRKVGKGLGYNVDISNPKPNLEMWYRKGGTHGVDELELISSDAKLVEDETEVQDKSQTAKKMMENLLIVIKSSVKKNLGLRQLKCLFMAGQRTL